MYTLLALACFVIIVWFLLGEVTADQTKPSKNDGSVFPAVLGGVLLAPVLALGAVLFALGRMAMVIPALVYGLFVLIQRLFEWAAENSREVAGHIGDSLRAIGGRIKRFLLSRSAGKKIQEFFITWREAGKTVLRYVRRLVAALENLLERVIRNVRSMVRDASGRIRKFRRSMTASGEHQSSSRRTSSARSSSASGLSASAVRLWRILASSRSSAGTENAQQKKHHHRKWALSALALFALHGMRQRASRREEREEPQEEERRSSAGERVHGSRFARKTKEQISSLYHGRYERDRISFRRVSSPASRQTDVLKNLRAVGWRVRSKIDRL